MAEAPNTVAKEQLEELFVANTVGEEEESSSDSE